ncbi:MAG: Glu/Leu/Phe/Val dehydrogenase dimerization domain-containing protein [Clostridia bacterium]
MQIFEAMRETEHEQLVFCYDKVSGLKAIIGIHDTTLGPALGGTRMWPYETEDEAIIDVLRLSRGMTYKNAAMGLNLGGGKGVIIADSRKDKSEALWRAYGRFVQSLGGRYYTAEDVGVSPDDIDIVNEETEYVAGLWHKSGDPSPATAYGTYVGIGACMERLNGSPDLAGVTVAVQGIGSVGTCLCQLLHEAGARLLVADIYEDKVARVVKDYDAEAVDPEEIHAVECDVYAPCALGATINDESIPKLNCRVVAGAANNQLAEERHGEMLRGRGILYAPDFVINGGGVINVAGEFDPAGYNREQAMKKVEGIGEKLAAIFEISDREDISTNRAALRLAEERIQTVGRIQRIRT